VTCAACGCQIKPGQLYIPWPKVHHIACPTPREIAHAKKVGREP
jgi:hypothetical protein